MKNLKIAYIGGGSKQWARTFMNDLTLCADLCGSVSLYDVDRDAAERNAVIGNILSSSPMAVSSWTYTVAENVQECLTGADFVIMSILPATFEQMRIDVHTPEKYGIYQSVGDTVGCGGVMRALRTVPIYIFYAQKIQKFCPKAFVINLTNPMSMCVKTLYDVFPEIKAVGCCHEVFHTQKLLCLMAKEILGVDGLSRKDIETSVSGINHFAWMTSAKYKNIDLLDILPEFIAKFDKTGYYENGTADDYKTNPFAYANLVKFDLFKRYGALPMGGDRHIVEFLNHNWYLSDPRTADRWKFALTSVDYRIADCNAKIQSSIRIADGREKPTINRSDEELIDIIRALCGKTSLKTNVIIPNTTQADDYPLGAIVENNAIITEQGIDVQRRERLPQAAANLVLQNILNNEQLYSAIKTKSLEDAFNCFVNQPSCSSLNLSSALSLFNEMLEGTKDYLTYYNVEGYLRKSSRKKFY